MIVRANISGSTLSSTVFLGFGKTTETVSGSWIKNDGKFHTLKIKYDPAGTLSFAWDNGQMVVRKLKNSGSISPASYNLVIGDRYSSTRMPFKGIISKIVLSSVDTKPAAESK